MNVQGMKVLHRSDTHTTVRHPAGHEIRLVHAKLKPDEMHQLKSLPKYAEGGEVGEQPESAVPAYLAPNAPQAAPDAQWESSAGMAGPAPQAEQPSNVRLPASSGPDVGAPNNSLLQPMQDAQNMQIQGIQGQAKAQGDLGKQEADIAGAQQKQSFDLNQKYQEKVQSLDQDRQHIMDDIAKGHIDPNHYINNLSTTGKIGTAIGIILGGFGGPGHNPGMDFLNKQIENDIGAQKADLGKKENLLSALQHQYGNLHDATLMAKTIYSDIYGAKIAQAAASAKTPMAQAAAQQAIGSLKAQTAPWQAEMGQRQAVMEGLGGGHMDPAMAVPHLVPAAHQKEVFDEISRAQDTQKNASGILDAFDKAASEARPGTGGLFGTSGTAFIPGMDAPSVKAFHAQMGPTFKDIEGTVRQAAMDNAFKNMTPQFGDSDSTVASKRASLNAYLQAKSAAPTAKAYGIDLAKAPSTANTKSKFKPSK